MSFAVILYKSIKGGHNSITRIAAVLEEGVLTAMLRQDGLNQRFDERDVALQSS